jgi:abhydrolase domain-containing protein 12
MRDVEKLCCTIGIILDAYAVIDWVINGTCIPPNRILIFTLSIGTAVSVDIFNYFALNSPSEAFAGTALLVPFTDAATNASLYRLAGTIPLSTPLAKSALLFRYLGCF